MKRGLDVPIKAFFSHQGRNTVKHEAPPLTVVRRLAVHMEIPKLVFEFLSQKFESCRSKQKTSFSRRMVSK